MSFSTTILMTGGVSSSSPAKMQRVREIPRDTGLPIIGPIVDRGRYFSDPEKFFKERIDKFKSTVIRVNMPPGPPIAWDSEVIMLLDSKSFPTLFDLTKVEKKDVLTGTYMPSTKFTGGQRVTVYLDPSEEKHNKQKQFCMELVARSRDRILPEFNRVFQDFAVSIEKQIAEKGRASVSDALQQLIFNFVCRTIAGADPLPTLGTDGPSMITRWLAPQLAPLASTGLLPTILEELTIHTIKIPYLFVAGDYNKLFKFIKKEASGALDLAEEMGLEREEACNDLLFNIGFNAFGGMLIMFPSIVSRIGKAGLELQKQIVKEVREVTENKKITMSGISQMSLVKSAVYEVLRMDPPVAAQYGRAKKNFTVESHDGVYEIKKGELLGGYQPLATKDPRVFNNGDEYVAERFVGEQGEELLSYLLWSNGRETEQPMPSNKQCAGKEFVVNMARLFVAHWFLRYDSFTLDPDSSSTITSLVKASS